MSRFSRGLVAAAALAALLPGSAAAGNAATLRPAMAVFTLAAGQSRAVDYTLGLPAQPQSPLDVHVLVDASASMLPRMPALRSALSATARAFAESDVRMGLGEYRTTSVADWSSDLTYRVLRQPGPVDAELERALAGLGTAQPGLAAALPGNDAHGVALDQVVTGDGQVPYVPGGRDVVFRAAARKVVVVVTDDPFPADPTQPSRDDVVAGLAGAGVKVVGLALDADALPDLSALAEGTRSVAGRRHGIVLTANVSGRAVAKAYAVVECVRRG